MATGVRTKYNVAINGKGYILRGAPDQPAYQRAVVATEIDRLAISDLAYSDFSGSGLFYVAQTDWNAGIKNEKTWRDDAKYYYSTNIDTYSEQGVIKLEKELTAQNDFTEILTCGGIDGSVIEFVGTEDNGSGYPQVYKYNGSSWSAIAATTFGTAKNAVSQLIAHNDDLYAGNVGIENTYSLGKYDGSSWSDLTAAVITAITGSNLIAVRAMESLAGALYVAGDDFLSENVYIASTTDAGSTFTEEVYLKSDGTIVSIKNYGGRLYYLLSDLGTVYLRVFDPATGADSEVTGGIFLGAGIDQAWGMSNLLRVFNGKLIITIPKSRIYEFDGTSITRIWKRDDNKNTIGNNANSAITHGAVERDSRLYWGNLIYDGEVFYNHKKPNGDSTSHFLRPVYTNSSDVLRYISTADRSILLEDLSTYKSTLSANFIVLSEMSQVSKIDKLLYSATVLFEPLASGEQIQIQYSIDDMDNWTTLNTLSPSSEGASTKKEIFLPTNVVFNKIWWRIFLDGASTTPKVLDFIMAYKPMPDYKNRWVMRLNMSDSFKLLNKQSEERSGMDLLSEIWVEKIAKQKVLFEDVDYRQCSLVSAMASGATSCLVDATRLFPRQGRMRIVSGGVSEEITYTSAETNKLLGVSRGLRGTRARAYATSQLIKNDFDVYVDNIRSEINFTDEAKTESIAQVTLIEA